MRDSLHNPPIFSHHAGQYRAHPSSVQPPTSRSCRGASYSSFQCPASSLQNQSVQAPNKTADPTGMGIPRGATRRRDLSTVYRWPPAVGRALNQSVHVPNKIRRNSREISYIAKINRYKITFFGGASLAGKTQFRCREKATFDLGPLQAHPTTCLAWPRARGRITAGGGSSCRGQSSLRNSRRPSAPCRRASCARRGSRLCRQGSRPGWGRTRASDPWSG